MKTALLLWLALVPRQDAVACATDLKHAPAASGPWVKYEEARAKKLAGLKHTAPQRNLSSNSDMLPTATSPNPWGGTDSKKWNPEAILGNAVSKALNDGWAQDGVDDVLVAVPLYMLYSDNRPYGDGQSNASPRFADPKCADPLCSDPKDLEPKADSWTSSEPPMVASWTTYQGGKPPVLKLHFSSDLDGLSGTGTATIVYYVKGVKHSWTLKPADPKFPGDLSWTPANDNITLTWGDAYTNNVAYVQAPGRGDWFPLDFRDVAAKAKDLLHALPAGSQVYSPTGLSLTDPMAIAPKPGEALTAYQKILAVKTPKAAPNAAVGPAAFGNNTHWYTPVRGIHNLFKNDITAVGDGSTWVLCNPPAPFKMAYICFDTRDESSEAENGAPSGGGWHEIGDPAETVFNVLESGRVVFGYANSHPGFEAPVGGYFRGLTDVAVIRELKPGYAIVTSAGKTTASEGDWKTESWPNRGKNGAGGRNYHWFIFNQERPPLGDNDPNRLCALEWVHPCTPTAADPAGVACGPPPPCH